MSQKVTGKLRVLVVDPSPIVQKLLAEHLKTTGLFASVMCAGDGAAAAQAALLRQVDLVVMDMSAPSVCAIRSTRIIKAFPHAPKVLLLCQREKPNHRRRARSAGANGFVYKLDCVDELAPAVCKLFQRYARSKNTK